MNKASIHRGTAAVLRKSRLQCIPCAYGAVKLSFLERQLQLVLSAPGIACRF